MQKSALRIVSGEQCDGTVRVGELPTNGLGEVIPWFNAVASQRRAEDAIARYSDPHLQQVDECGYHWPIGVRMADEETRHCVDVEEWRRDLQRVERIRPVMAVYGAAIGRRPERVCRDDDEEERRERGSARVRRRTAR